MFAGARERIGSDAIEVETQLPVSVAQFKQSMALQYESLKPFAEFGRIAIDNAFVDDSAMIDESHSRSTIALIPPVSGG